MSNIKKVGFVVDSTLTMPVDIVEKYNMSVVDLHLFNDGIEIPVDTPNISLMSSIKEGVKVTTSQPSPDEFLQGYKKQLKRGVEHVFVYTCSSKLSGTYSSANLARDMLDKKEQEKIIIFDTLSVSIGSQIFVEETIRLLENDEPIENIVPKLTVLQENSYLLFTVDSLETIYKNGRLGKVRFIIGSIIKVKPILKYHSGVLESASSGQLGIERALKFLVKKLKSEIEKFPNDKFEVRTAYVDSVVNYKKLAKMIENECPNVKIVMGGEISQIISVHIGPGGLGICIIHR